MPISYKHKAVFVHIPKTGGQSVSSMLSIAKHSVPNLYAQYLTHLSIDLIEKRADITGKYIFTFVRDPYTKILSEYDWRMRNRHSIIYNEPTDQLMSFPEYMDRLYYRWPMLDDVNHHEKAHILPQHVFIDERVDVYRFENFAADWKKVTEILGVPYKMKHVNRGPQHKQHTKRTIEIVNELYAEDFKQFGYEFR